MEYLPIFVSTRGGRAIVVGGGLLAEAKCRALLKTAAEVVLFCEEPTSVMLQWRDESRLQLETRSCDLPDLQTARLVYAAGECEHENTRIAQMSNEAGVWVNVVDRPDACDFITPAIVDRDPVVVAIGTEGAAPVLAQQIKLDVESMLPIHLGVVARAAQQFRHRVRQLLPGLPRRRFWTDFFQRSTQQADLSPAALEATLSTLLEQHQQWATPEGKVIFVGAGPGDPDLLTVKARRMIQEADVVVYDRLVGDQILDLARKEAKFINAGKKGFGVSMPQADISAHLLREASQGQLVVRLKGGDPGMFGRLDEELTALTGAGVTTEIIPGITAAAAAAATLQVSLTQRGRNTRVTFLTAHDAKGYAEHDWQQLVDTQQALAVYMGRKTAAFLQGRLLMHGANRLTPVTCIENVSRRDQRAFVSYLDGFVGALDEQRFDGPLMILVGIAGAVGASDLREHVNSVGALEREQHGSY
jgi:uroporphyrin-III C-methyltransferase/precorrin-2 dehydrogenase/sirohydrochlorin ferrochelatase